MDFYKLSSGQSIPAVGLSTAQLVGHKGERIIANALHIGHTHLDTAQIYCNDDIIGRCTQPYSRDSLFITSKIAPWQYGTRNTYEAVSSILKNLQTDYIDLLLLQWPGVYGRDYSDSEQVRLRHESYRVLELLQDSGKVNDIGVANFLPLHLDKLAEECSVKPAVNQIEFHPLCQGDQVVQYCKDENILVEANSCLAQRDKRLWKHKYLELIAQDTGKTKAQVLLRWTLDKEVVALPQAHSLSRLREFTQLNFELTSYQTSLLDSINCSVRLDSNPHLITV